MSIVATIVHTVCTQCANTNLCRLLPAPVPAHLRRTGNGNGCKQCAYSVYSVFAWAWAWLQAKCIHYVQCLCVPVRPEPRPFPSYSSHPHPADTQAYRTRAHRNQEPARVDTATQRLSLLIVHKRTGHEHREAKRRQASYEGRACMMDTPLNSCLRSCYRRE